MAVQGQKVRLHVGNVLQHAHEAGHAVGVIQDIHGDAVLIGLVRCVVVVQGVVDDVVVVAGGDHQLEGGGGVHHGHHVEFDMDVVDVLKGLVEIAGVVGAVHDGRQRWRLGVEHGQRGLLLHQGLDGGPVKVLVAGYRSLRDGLLRLLRGLRRRGSILLRRGKGGLRRLCRRLCLNGLLCRRGFRRGFRCFRRSGRGGSASAAGQDADQHRRRQQTGKQFFMHSYPS